MTNLKIGAKLASAVCDVQVMVIRSSLAEADLRCGGAAMLAQGETAPADAVLDPAQAEGLQAGKRYTDVAERVELLCVKGGAGSITLDGERIVPRLAKKLPSSD